MKIKEFGKKALGISGKFTRYFGEIWGSRKEALDILENLRIKVGG